MRRIEVIGNFIAIVIVLPLIAWLLIVLVAPNP